MNWTPEAIATLERGWLAGKTTAAIGLELRCSKNAVVGKAHRLKLPGRESPIPRPGHAPKRPVRPEESRTAVAAIIPAVVVAEPVKPPVRASVGRDEGCRFIAGPTRNAIYCNEPVERGAYCAEHAALCFVRREAA